MARVFMLAAAVLLQVGVLQAAESPQASDATDPDSELYYAVDRPFESGGRWETQLSAGYDFSNPYLHRYSGTIGTYWLVSPSLATGVEFSGFTTDMRSGASALQQQLAAYAFRLNPVAPRAGAVGVARLTPISGLVNLFSTYLIKADISILARGGALYYDGRPLGALIGTGLDVGLGFSSHFGWHVTILWDGEKPPGLAWESKVGFRSGPTVRF